MPGMRASCVGFEAWATSHRREVLVSYLDKASPHREPRLEPPLDSAAPHRVFAIVAPRCLTLFSPFHQSVGVALLAH